MRVAMISDIHSNLPALEAVLAAIDERRRRRALVPGRRRRLRRPARRLHELVARALRRSAWSATTTSPCSASSTSRLLGRGGGGGRVDPRANAAGDARVPARASPEARAARSASSTPRRATRSGSTCSRSTRPSRVHGASRPQRVEPDRPLPRRALLRLRRRRPAATSSTRRGAQAGDGRELDIAEGRWLINPGSVGQPRDGDPRAAWLELDTEAWTAAFHRVAYEIDRGRRGDPRRGLPELLAERLYVGAMTLNCRRNRRRSRF